MGILLKSERELAKMRAAGRVVRAVLDAVEAALRPRGDHRGAERDRRAGAAAREGDVGVPRVRLGGAPPYPAVLCTSVNAVVVHGIPDRRQVLREGDVVGIDFACYKDGYCADAARTVAVGVVSAPARALISATEECLERAIRACVPGARLGDVGAAIQGHAEELGYAIVRELVGHGIGRAMHEPPNVPNHGREGSGLRLRPGIVLAIEPMLNAGGADVRLLHDGWTVVTADASLSAHVEHTVAVTDDGPRVLTAA